MMEAQASFHGPLTTSPLETFDRDIDFSLVATDGASCGEMVHLKWRLQNVSDDPASLRFGVGPPYDFVISTPSSELA